MNLREALIRQIEIEHKLSLLYRHFFLVFRAYPAYNTFWMEMSNDEAGHENLLRTLLDVVDDRTAVETDLPNLSVEMFERLETLLSNSVLESKSPKFYLRKAFDTAVKLESSEAEIIYENILETLDPIFDRALTHFIADNLNHKEQLRAIGESIPPALEEVGCNDTGHFLFPN